MFRNQNQNNVPTKSPSNAQQSARQGRQSPVRLPNPKTIARHEQLELLQLLDNCTQIMKDDRLILRGLIKDGSGQEVEEILQKHKKRQVTDIPALTIELRRFLNKGKKSTSTTPQSKGDFSSRQRQHEKQQANNQQGSFGDAIKKSNYEDNSEAQQKQKQQELYQQKQQQLLQQQQQQQLLQQQQQQQLLIQQQQQHQQQLIQHQHQQLILQQQQQAKQLMIQQQQRYQQQQQQEAHQKQQQKKQPHQQEHPHHQQNEHQEGSSTFQVSLQTAEELGSTAAFGKQQEEGLKRNKHEQEQNHIISQQQQQEEEGEEQQEEDEEYAPQDEGSISEASGAKHRQDHQNDFNNQYEHDDQEQNDNEGQHDHEAEELSDVTQEQVEQILQQEQKRVRQQEEEMKKRVKERDLLIEATLHRAEQQRVQLESMVGDHSEDRNNNQEERQYTDNDHHLQSYQIQHEEQQDPQDDYEGFQGIQNHSFPQSSDPVRLDQEENHKIESKVHTNHEEEEAEHYDKIHDLKINQYKNDQNFNNHRGAEEPYTPIHPVVLDNELTLAPHKYKQEDIAHTSVEHLHTIIHSSQKKDNSPFKGEISNKTIQHNFENQMEKAYLSNQNDHQGGPLIQKTNQEKSWNFQATNSQKNPPNDHLSIFNSALSSVGQQPLYFHNGYQTTSTSKDQQGLQAKSVLTSTIPENNISHITNEKDSMVNQIIDSNLNLQTINNQNTNILAQKGPLQSESHYITHNFHVFDQNQPTVISHNYNIQTISQNQPQPQQYSNLPLHFDYSHKVNVDDHHNDYYPQSLSQERPSDLPPQTLFVPKSEILKQFSKDTLSVNESHYPNNISIDSSQFHTQSKPAIHPNRFQFTAQSNIVFPTNSRLDQSEAADINLFHKKTVPSVQANIFNSPPSRNCQSTMSIQDNGKRLTASGMLSVAVIRSPHYRNQYMRGMADPIANQDRLIGSISPTREFEKRDPSTDSIKLKYSHLFTSPQLMSSCQVDFEKENVGISNSPRTQRLVAQSERFIPNSRDSSMEKGILPRRDKKSYVFASAVSSSLCNQSICLPRFVQANANHPCSDKAVMIAKFKLFDHSAQDMFDYIFSSSAQTEHVNLQTFRTRVQSHFPFVNQTDIDDLFDLFDLGESEYLDINGVGPILMDLCNYKSKEQGRLIKVFNFLDGDKKGFVTRLEAEIHLHPNILQKNYHATAVHISQELFKEADQANKGYITYWDLYSCKNSKPVKKILEILTK